MSDDRTITIDDVAKLAGVSRATAGRVVGNYGSVSEKSRERVWDAVRQLDYQPNLIARGLRSQTTKTIAVIVGSIRNTYSTALVYAVEKEAQKKGYNVLICTTHEDIEKELKHLKDLNKQKSTMELFLCLHIELMPTWIKNIKNFISVNYRLYLLTEIFQE